MEGGVQMNERVRGQIAAARPPRASSPRPHHGQALFACPAGRSWARSVAPVCLLLSPASPPV